MGHSESEAPEDGGGAATHRGAYVITNAEDSYDEQHRRRVRRYMLIMSIRIPALILAAVAYSATGNGLLALGILAISIPIPWIAVVRANDRPKRRRGEPGRFTARKLERHALQSHDIKTVARPGE